MLEEILDFTDKKVWYENNNFKIFSNKEEQELSVKQLMEYYHELREYLKKCPYNNITEKQMIAKEKQNKRTKKILEKILPYKVIIDGYENIPSYGPVIYASSHQDFFDVINSVYAYPEHAITLNAVNIRWILKPLLDLNGVVYVDRNCKKNRFEAKLELQKALAKGKSINMYPEATLNCTPSKLHLPFYIGLIDIAKKMGVPIIPVVQEYNYNQEKLDGHSHIESVHIRFGRQVCVSPRDDLITKLEEFDEVFSTIRWQLIEEKGWFKRSEISNKLYTDYIKARIRDWRIPNNSIYEERKQVYLANDDFYLFHHVNDVDFDLNDNLLPTEHVRKLSLIHNKHLNK